MATYVAEMPDFRLVLIEWEDSYGCGSNWMPIEGCVPSVLLCQSVGWLIYDGEDCKVIVPHLSQAGHPNANRQGCGDMTIPTSAIKRVRTMRAVARKVSGKK